MSKCIDYDGVVGMGFLALTYQREFLDMKMQKQCHGTSVKGLLESRMNDLHFVSSLTPC